MTRFCICIFLGFSSVLSAQTFSDNPEFFLPDDGGTYMFEIEVSGLPNTIDMSFGIERLCLNLTHTYDSDAWIRLQSPDGTVVDLSIGNGGGEDNYTTTCFTENAFLTVQQGSPPYNGNFQPQGDLNALNNGQNPNGTWTLIYWDSYAFADTGTLYDWSISFTDELINPEPDPYYFEESKLPLVWIDTFGQAIPDEPGVSAYMDVVDNGIGQLNQTDDPFTYSGNIDIELRGQSTLGFPKKSYGFETRDELNNDLDTTMLGMPADEDWIFYAPYSEKSLMQNALAMDLGRAMGRYNSRVRFCEMFVNDVYDGIYLLMEKIKQENDRVDIADLNPQDIAGEEVTGGYIFRMDWGNDVGWSSPFPIPADPNNHPYYQFVYPRPEVVVPEQYNYLKGFVDSFEYAVNSPVFTFGGKRYDEYIDLSSFVDNFIMNELSKNVDAYRLSSYYSKEKNGKIIAGPLWDFNLSFGNADYCDGADDNDWNYQVCGTSGPSWWPRFMADSVFTNLVKCRWDYLRTNVLDENNLNARIDSMAVLLSEAADRNFTRWPVLGIYVWPNPAPYATTFPEAVDQLKSWVSNRIAWLDDHITGNPLCVPYLDNNSQNTEYFEENQSPPNCWSTLDVDGDGNTWVNGTPVLGYNSSHCAYSDSFSLGEIILDPDDYLITPQLTPLVNEHLTYFVASAADGTPETWQVLLSVTGTDPADFTTVLWEETISTATWQFRAADLSAWWGQNIYIAFRHFNSLGGYRLMLDEIRYPTWTQPGQDCSVGVGENAQSSVVHIFPNPSEGSVVVDAGGLNLTHVEVLDATGRICFEQELRDQRFSLDLTNLASGLYQARFFSDGQPQCLPVMLVRSIGR